MRLCNTLAQLRSAFILHREAQWSLQRPAKLAGLPDLTFVMVMRLHNASYKGFAEKKAWSGGKRAKVEGHFRHAEQESLCLISGQDLATAIICYLILTLAGSPFRSVPGGSHSELEKRPNCKVGWRGPHRPVEPRPGLRCSPSARRISQPLQIELALCLNRNDFRIKHFSLIPQKISRFPARRAENCPACRSAYLEP